MIDALYTIIYSRELGIIGLILAFGAWIAGIMYCERVVDELEWNPWIARISSILLPALAPGAFWWLRRRYRRHRRYRRRPPIL